jgi:hypothetical protein
MDAAPVCDGKRKSEHLKRFFLFLPVDAQGSRKVTAERKRAVKLRLGRLSGPEDLSVAMRRNRR